MTKSELRKIYLAERKLISPEERKEKSRSIAERFFRFFDLSEIKYLHCFLPIEKFNEVDTRLILDGIWRDFPQIQVLVPRVNFQTQEIENLKINAETHLILNVWEIEEPRHDETVESEKIDLILVPLLCFDRSGFRVGYGKGFYDKLLSRCRADALKIGLSFFPQVEKISDVREFDEKLDYCITPGEVLSFKTEGERLNRRTK